MDKIYQKLFLGAKNVAKRRLGGFTLIELLVVVLIIGILAAMALPQYQKAVAKSRLTELTQQAYAIRNSLRLHQMAAGTPATKLDDLDIWTSSISNNGNESAYIGKQQYSNVGGNYIRTYVKLSGDTAFQCDFHWNGKRGFCYVFNEKGEQLAQSMGWEKYKDDANRPYYIGRKADWNY